MAELLVKPGTKMHMAFDVPLGKTPDFTMLVTFQKALDDAFFLVSVPMLNDKKLLMDENQKMLLQYGEGEEAFIIAAFPEVEEKVGIRTFWKMRQVAERRTFSKRKDERIKVQMPLQYMSDYSSKREWEDALSIDISGEGMAMYLNDFVDVGEAMRIVLPEIDVHDEAFTVSEQVGVICWLRDAPKGSVYHRLCGLQFHFADDLEREELREYINHVRAKYKI